MIKDGEMVYLIAVDPKTNSNKYYKIERFGNELVCTYGRVQESNFSTHRYPVEKFYDIYKKKTNRRKNPYVDQTHLYKDNAVIAQDSMPNIVVKDETVATFMNKIQSVARKTVQSALSVDIGTVTENHIERSQQQLNIVAQLINTSVEEANDALVQQFTIIPRFINRRTGVASLLFNGNEEHDKGVLESEFDLLDRLQTLVTQRTKPEEYISTIELRVNNDEDVLQRFYNGLEAQYTKSKVLNCFSVHNTSSDFCQELGNIQSLWHGSATPNWNSIIENGLMIKPPGIPTAGSMFGNGIYFATISQKSLGYTDYNSSILALYHVALGNTQINHSGKGWGEFSIEKALSAGYDSLWCYGKTKNPSSVLYNDEIIVGSSNQANLVYIFEVTRH